jgi:hypothetical protein
MKLNQAQTTNVIVDKKSIHVEYYFTENEVCGPSGDGNIWVVMTFIHPESRQKDRLKVSEPESILNASEDEIHSFIEREVECFIKDCAELYN